MDVRKYHGLWAKPKSLSNAERPRGERAAVLALAHLRSDQPLDVAAVLCACCVPCDHIALRRWPLFKARDVMRGVIESFRAEITQWGWGGYSTQNIERGALSARAVALIYNGWRWYVRLANPKNRMEAITGRPKLAERGGQADPSWRPEQDLADRHA